MDIAEQDALREHWRAAGRNWGLTNELIEDAMPMIYAVPFIRELLGIGGRMDIGEIKIRLDLQSTGATVDYLAMAKATLWIIEKLQEVPSVEVLQLGSDDVLVGTFDRPVPDAMAEHYRNQLEGHFPDNRVVLVEGLVLSVVRGEAQVEV